MPDFLTFLDFMESVGGEGHFMSKSYRERASRIFVSVREDEQGSYVHVMRIPYEGIIGASEFIIRNGNEWDWAEDHIFLNFVHNPIIEPIASEWQTFIDKAKMTWPEYNLPNYANYQSAQALEHIFYCSKKETTPQKLLFTAGYHNIARVWDIADRHRETSTLKEVFGCTVPKKLLCILNQSCELAERAKPDRIKKNIKIFKAYHSETGGEKINESQWKYIEALADQGHALGFNGFQKSAYRLLSQNRHWDLFELYEDYIRLCDELKSYRIHRERNLPSPREIVSKVNRLETLEELVSTDIDARIKAKAKVETFNYENEDYLIRMPRDLAEFYNEGDKMSNCILNYAEKHANNTGNILFMRRKSSPNKPYVDIEVNNDGLLVQAYRSCNKPVTQTDAHFLKEFCSKKGVRFDYTDEELATE